MQGDTLFQAVLDHPDDDAVRLVYADWLEDRGSPQADYLRTELALARLPANAPEVPALREQLWQLWGKVDPDWLAVFTQPRLLRANPTPYPSAWEGIALGRYRPCDGTYCSWPYGSLPPLPVAEFRSEFQWLTPVPSERITPEEREWFQADPLLASSNLNPAYPQRLQRLVAAVTQQGLRFPESYLRFMGVEGWQNAVNSPTGCSFRVPEQLTPDPVGGRGFHLTCYCDSQDVVAWDLYLHPSGGYCVVAYLPDFFNPVDGLDPQADEVGPNNQPPVSFVAPSFEAFVYRVWLESQVWWFAHGDFLRRRGRPVPPLTAEMQAYLNHYERQAAPLS